MRRNTDIIKNIKRVSCRFDMDVPEERRAWQILRFRHDLLTGKKQDYTTILAKAMVGYYDRTDDRDLTNRELLNELRESIFKEADKIRDSLGELTYPAVYPCIHLKHIHKFLTCKTVKSNVIKYLCTAVEITDRKSVV